MSYHFEAREVVRMTQYPRMTDAQRQFVEDNMGLVGYTLVHMVKTRIQQVGMPWEDARQVGYLALCKAAVLWDPSKGTFATYAVRAIRNDIVMACCKHKAMAKKGATTSHYVAPIMLSLDDQLKITRHRDGKRITIADRIPDPRAEFEGDVVTSAVVDKAIKRTCHGNARCEGVIRDRILGHLQRECGRRNGYTQSYASKILKRFTRYMRCEMEASNCGWRNMRVQVLRAGVDYWGIDTAR